VRAAGPPLTRADPELVSAGQTTKEIGEELHLEEKAVKDVKTYASNFPANLEVTRRAEAACLTRHTTTPARRTGRS